MAALTPLTVGNAAAPNEWASATNGVLGDNSDATFGANTTNATGTVVQGWAMGNVDADLGNVDTLAIVLRYAWSAAVSNSTWNTLAARVMDGATVLAAANSGGAFKTVASSITTTSPTNSGSTAFDYVNTAANKTAWDAAVVEIQIVRTRAKGGDATEQRVFECDLTGTYTAAAAPEEHSGTFAGTGGGVIVAAATKAGLASVSGTGGGVIATASASQRSATLAGTGGGVIAAVSSGSHAATIAGTGGGVVTAPATTDRPAALAGTGGGTFALTYSTAEGDNDKVGTFAATGGGVVTIAATSERSSALVGTASGVITTASGTERAAPLTGTAAGALTAGSETGRTLAVSGTGGGAFSAPVATARATALAGTGGGVATFVGGSAEAHAGSLAATGGGTFALASTTARGSVLAATASGAVSLSVASARLAAALMSGGGVLTTAWTGAHVGSFTGTGGGSASISANVTGPGLPAVVLARIEGRHAQGSLTHRTRAEGQPVNRGQAGVAVGDAYQGTIEPVVYSGEVT